METGLLFWVIALCLISGVVSTPTPVLTIESPDGDLIDCINREDQPAFRHPLLKNHKFTATPTDMEKKEVEHTWQIWHMVGTKCLEGSIPVRRITSDRKGTSSINAEDKVTRNHEYALGFLKSESSHIYGTKATMSVWHPKIEEDAGEFSLGQIWLVSGSYNHSDLNTIEAGWQVYPQLYLDNQPRLFIFWTRDAYNLTRCYNLRCAGFVQTSRTVAIEGAISPSTFGGRQTDLTIQIWKDPKLALWWLGVGLNNGSILEPVGYWPTEIFTHLSEYAEQVQWGGEITNRNISGRHTTTQMGSGYLPDAGFGKAAYMRDLAIAVNKSDWQPLSDLRVEATNPGYYNVKKSSETSFYYGGQAHARAVRVRVDFGCFVFLFRTFIALLVFLYLYLDKMFGL